MKEYVLGKFINESPSSEKKEKDVIYEDDTKVVYRFLDDLESKSPSPKETNALNIKNGCNYLHKSAK